MITIVGGVFTIGIELGKFQNVGMISIQEARTPALLLAAGAFLFGLGVGLFVDQK